MASAKFQAFTCTNVHNSPLGVELEACGLFCLGGGGLLGYPPVTDTCLLEKPRTTSGSHSKWGLTVTGIKLPPRKDFQGVCTLHIRGHVGFWDWAEPKRSGVPLWAKAAWHNAGCAFASSAGQRSQGPATRQLWERLGHRSRPLGLPGILPNSKP